ncbi:MAG: hypothetical protein ABWX84_04060 [Nocardioides sp.]
MNAETPTDAQLMEAIRDLWEVADPPPPDLADGVLAALAAADLELEYELMTLIEASGVPNGVRGAKDATTDGPWTLEYSSDTCHLLVRVSTVDGVRRLDGWVVPAVAMTVVLAPAGTGGDVLTQEGQVDGNGRFEFAAPGTGQARLSFTPHDTGDPDAPRPFATPAFLV